MTNGLYNHRLPTHSFLPTRCGRSGWCLPVVISPGASPAAAGQAGILIRLGATCQHVAVHLILASNLAFALGELYLIRYFSALLFFLTGSTGHTAPCIPYQPFQASAYPVTTRSVQVMSLNKPWKEYFHRPGSMHICSNGYNRQVYFSFLHITEIVGLRFQ